MLHIEMNAVHAGDVFQRGQDHRAVTIGLLAGWFAGHRIELLGKTATVPDQNRQEFLSQAGDLGKASIILQGIDRALIGETLWLAAPVVAQAVVKERIVDGDGWQRNGRPEFIGVEQMMIDERVRHFLGEDAVPHAAQVVMDELGQAPAVAIAVEAGFFSGSQSCLITRWRNSSAAFRHSFSRPSPSSAEIFARVARAL